MYTLSCDVDRYLTPGSYQSCPFCRDIVACEVGLYCDTEEDLSHQSANPALACLRMVIHCSVLVVSRIILRTYHQTSTLLCTSINDLDNIYQILLVFDGEIELVVVTCAEIAHHVFVTPEEHYCTDIIEFIHLVEVLNFGIVTGVDDRKVSDFVSNLEKHLVLLPCNWVFGIAKTNDHDTFIL